MADEATFIIRAAAGDLGAWEELSRRSGDLSAVRRAAALPALDDDPPPLASLPAVAAPDDAAPDRLQSQARRRARALAPAEQQALRRAGRRSAARMLVALGADLPTDARRAPLAAVARSPAAVRRAAKRAWDAPDDADRVDLACAAARHADPDGAGAPPARLGGAGYMAPDETIRAALGSNGMAALPEMQGVEPIAVVNAAPRHRRRPDRRRARPTAHCAAGRHVAHALARDALWRRWMQEFFPDAHASDAAVAGRAESDAYGVRRSRRRRCR